MSLNAATREHIRTYLLDQVTRYVQEGLAKVRHKPFHERLMPPLSLVPFSERSFSTRLGGWFQEMALAVASQYNAEAHTNYLVGGHIQPAASAHIAAILEAMDHGNPRRIPNRELDIVKC